MQSTVDLGVEGDGPGCGRGRECIVIVYIFIVHWHVHCRLIPGRQGAHNTLQPLISEFNLPPLFNPGFRYFNMQRQHHLPSLITFGSLASWPSAYHLRDFQKAITSDESLSPVTEAVRSLPAFWDTLASINGSLLAVAGRNAAERLVAWVTTGEGLGFGTDDAPPSAIAMPMTIIAHLCQYLDYLQHNENEDISHTTLVESAARRGGIQGFCAGLLSALAIAGAEDTKDIGQHGALAVRLAFAIGVYVDLDSSALGETECLAARWKSPAGLEELQDAIQKYDGVSDTMPEKNKKAKTEVQGQAAN